MRSKSLYLCGTLFVVTLLTACSSTGNTSTKELEHSLSVKVKAIGQENSGLAQTAETKVASRSSGKSNPLVPASIKVHRGDNSITPSISAKDIVGRWKGEVSMINHSHPLYIDVDGDKNGGVVTSFNFFGMDTNSVNVTSDNGTSFNLKSGQVSFFLPQNGVKFSGRITSASTILGQVDWMGIKQPLKFEKISDKPGQKKQNRPEMATAYKPNIAILLFDGADVLDWSGPLEVFQNAHAFNVYTVAAQMRAYDGSTYQIFPKYTFANMPKADILVIPGGAVAKLFHQANVMDWLKHTSVSADITMSVCNAATILGRLNILDGLDATTHASWMSWLNLQSTQHHFNVVDGPRFVDNGKVITTAGVSSGIDGALHLVARLKGFKRAQMAARMIEYDWRPDHVEQYH